MDEFAVKTYGANLKRVRLIERTIEAVTVAGDNLEPVDVLHAGFPCQSFSQAGERRGFDDPRGRLFFEIIRLWIIRLRRSLMKQPLVRFLVQIRSGTYMRSTATPTEEEE